MCLAIFTIYVMWTKKNLKLDVNYILSLLTFITGFTYNGFVHINNTKKAETLKVNESFSEIYDPYASLMAWDFLSIVFTIAILVLKNFINVTVLICILLMVISQILYKTYEYWNLTSKFLRRTDK